MNLPDQLKLYFLRQGEQTDSKTIVTNTGREAHPKEGLKKVDRPGNSFCEPCFDNLFRRDTSQEKCNDKFFEEAFGLLVPARSKFKNIKGG